MSTQISVNLAFTANTEQAKQQLQALQTQLNNITMNTKLGSGMTEDLQGAVKAATELQIHLKNATNVKTGNLDFAKLNQSIKQSGMTLEQYGMKLRSIGPQGQQAFMSLANSIASAEIPLKRSNKLLQSFSTTLANTAKWQLSSSMLHGFMSATQAAYGYAQDLNESLNNIRIVTGQNIDQMAQFAKEANKAAQALSTTTTEYTNASLIYYQQGLNDQQVKERTDITIKMANVARQSAEVVSDQMTAVWNNFYDGSKSLEHYADVMTALGAATASSTDEIAGGLEKFAAIGNTIGLSFEYAASALATITSNTRQSEEVVGTALKTLFARIQGLSLGETLEDGVDLNKYSEALNKVGISVLDSSGEMRKMDDILDDMASKWDTLSKAQQTALAQTVAGVRQYTQLVALMENWNNGDSDSMIANLTTSASSGGALQKQADIYAESWEGARDRVKAAAESIYSSLINDEAFIDMLDGVEKVLKFIKELIDSLGGLKGVLMAIGTIVTKVFSQQLSQGLSTMAYNIKMATKSGREKVNNERIDFIDKAKNSIAQPADYDDPIVTAQKESMESQLTLQKEMLTNAEKMSQYEFERNKMLIDRSRLMKEQVVTATKEKQQADNAVDSNKYNLQSRIYSGGGSKKDQAKSVQELNYHIDNIRQDSKTISGISTAFDKFSNGAAKGKKEVTELQRSIASLKTGDQNVQELTSNFAKLNINADNAEQQVQELIAQIRALTNQSAKNIKNLIPVDENDAQEQKQVRQEIDNLVSSIDQQISAENKCSAAVTEGANAHKLATDAIQASIGVQKTWSDVIVEGANVAFSAAMAFQMLGSMIDTLKDPDVSGWEKFQSVLMTLGMTIPMLVSVWSTLKSLISAETVAKIANVAATIAQIAVEKSYKKVKNDSADATNNNIDATNKDTKRKLGQTIKDKGKNLKQTWNETAFKKQGGTLHKNGTSSIFGRQGIVSKQETSQLVSQVGKTAGKALLKSAGSALAIAASIAAAGAIVKTAIDHYNRFEIAAEKAKEVAQSISATYDQIKASETEFRNSIDSYNSGVEGLDKLTKGTEEYKDAVRAANEEAVKLLNTYDDLNYEINEDGLIVIEKAELAAEKQKSLFDEAIAFSAKTHAQQDAENAQLEADKVEFQRTQMKAGGVHWDNDDTTAVAGGVGAGVALGVGAAVAFANAWNPVGWAMIIAGALSAVIGVGIAAFNNDADIREAKTLEALEEFSTQSGGRSLTKEEIESIANKEDPSGKLADSLLEDVDATNEMIAEMRANTEAINRNNELIANQILQGNAYVQGSEHYDEIVDASGLYEGQAYEDALANVIADKWGQEGIASWDGANDQAKKVWSEYLTYAGLEDKGWELVDTKGDDKNRIFVYLDENGQRQEKTLTEMQKTRAAYEAGLKTNANAIQLTSFFAEWSKKEGAGDQAFTSFLLNKNFEDATKNEFDTMKNTINNEYGGDIESYLTSQLGDLEEAAKKLGYDGADALITAFTNAINNMDTEWADTNLDNWDPNVAKNAKQKDTKSINDIGLSMTGRVNKQGDQLFVKGITDLVKDLKPEDQEEALSRLAQIDWTQWNAGWQAVDVLKALGYELDLSDGNFAEWVMAVNRASGATFDYSAAVADLNKMIELSNTLEFGGIISQEDYDLLVKYNGEVAKYFRILGDGTYKLTGDPLDARQAIGDGIDAAYGEAIAGAQANYDNAVVRQNVDNAVKASEYSRDQLSGTTWGTTKTDIIPDAIPNETEWYHYVGGFFAAAAPGNTQTISSHAQNIAGYHDKVVEHKGIVDKDLYKAQIDFIDKYMEGYTDAQIEAWRKASDETSANQVAAIVSGYLEQYDPISTDEVTGYSDELEKAKMKQFSAEVEYASSAESADQLREMYDEKQIGNQAFNTAAMEFATQEKWEDMDPEAVEDYADVLMDAAEASSILSDELKNNEEAAEDVALYTQKMNKGIDKLADGFEDWSDVLKKSDEGSQEYADAMTGMKKAMSDVLGVSEDFLSNDFIIKNMKDIELAANGDAAAIDRLALAAAKDILIHVNFEDEEAKTKALTLHDELAGMVPNIKVGAEIDDGNFFQKAQKIIETAGMTADQANAYFRSMGFEAKFKTETKDVEQKVPITYTKQTVTDVGWDGGPTYTTKTSSWTDGYETHTGKMDVVAMSTNGKTPIIESITRTNSGSMNNYSSSNKGGKSPGSKSSSKPKKVDRPKKSDMVDRYREIDDALNDLRETMADTDRLADNLWGPKRINQLESNIGLIEEEVELLKERNRQSEAYLKQDRQELDKAAKKLGFTVEYDEDGDVLNATAIQEALFKRKDNAIVSANKGGVNDTEQETLDALDDDIDAFETALDRYDTTKQEMVDNQNAIEDGLQKILDMHATIFSEKWELEVELNEDELQRLDYYLSKTENDFYQRAEGLAILGQQTGVYTQQLETQQAAWDELNQLKAEGKISDEFYMEQLNATKDSIYDNLEALQDLDKQMMEYYGETLQMASDEIDKITDQMEHHNSVLEHYLSILELMGESANYKTIGVVLEGQAEVKKDRMIAAQQEWQMFQTETDAKYLAWKTATDEASAEMLKKQYEDALAVSTEKQEEYLSLAEEYAESLKAILENSLKEYAQDLENALTGGTSFDQMNTKLERAAALQEEYLTTTNKIYETNKLMNTAQQEIDKTTNTIAKQRLKQFIDETNQLQKKNKLSKYELDIQQAKYDLLLAEIALEEAQNAKSSVRLQRDSEGNFGYVYTADQDKIAEAQQKLADAQNSLYNIALEGSNDYFTKYQETINEMYDYFTELHQQYLDGEFESEQEYQNAVAEAKAYYYELLEQYSDLYTIAISTDARALEDAWSSEFNSMVYNTKNWQTQVDIYIQRSQQSFSKYAKEIDTLTGELGVSGSYNEVANSVGNIVDQNEALLATLLSPGGVFDTMEMEIALVNDVCAAYAVERATVLELIKTYEALALSIMNVKRVEAGKEPLGSLNLPTNNAEQDTAVPGSAKAGDGVPKVGDRVKYNSGKYYHSSDGLSPTGTRYQGSEVYITDINTASWAKYPYHISTGNRLYSGDLGWLKLNQISGYDTGGYTGRWGSYGKLAMLHEKEIVLNKQDTENLLQSMELLDNIVKTIDLYSANQQVSGLLNSPSFGKLDSGTLEQTVTIDAHFPNVSSRVEIEEAFSTLINRASQYVNRN